MATKTTHPKVTESSTDNGQVNTDLLANAAALEKELDWLSQVIMVGTKNYFGEVMGDSQEKLDMESLLPPNLSESTAPYAHLVKKYQMNMAERLCLILALAPHIRPQVLDVFYIKNKISNRRFAEFGGIVEGPENDFFPTGETLTFLLAGNDLNKRFNILELFEANHFFSKENILEITQEKVFHSPLKSPLRLSKENLSLLTTGKVTRPHFSLNFPAHLISTELNWEDLVLPENVLRQVKEIEHWIKHGDTLLKQWKMAGKIRPGYRALFHGPPGTGKTLTACLLGKKTGHNVYRIDISTVVSKYIGETEKNLSRIFDLAEHKKWILFFDEADALFGKRSETKGAHDRYANQEVSYLLQRVEAFHGIIILASNYKANIDSAFARRFESMIYFPIPEPQERLRLWENGFSEKAQLDKSTDLEHLAQQYSLSGGAIMNVIRYVSLQSLAKGNIPITSVMIRQGLVQELAKEGRVLS